MRSIAPSTASLNCRGEVSKAPLVRQETLQEVWPLGDAAFAIFLCGAPSSKDKLRPQVPSPMMS